MHRILDVGRLGGRLDESLPPPVVLGLALRLFPILLLRLLPLRLQVPLLSRPLFAKDRLSVAARLLGVERGEGLRRKRW